MGVPDPEQYRQMLDAAAEGGYAYPAVNVTSSETLNAALRGFAEAESDGIVELTTGGAAYVSGAAVGNGERGARALAAFAREVAGDYDVLVALHTDHCPPDQVDTFVRPLLAESLRRRERGEPPLFNSHMFDGSTLPLEENLRIAAELLEQCVQADVVLEVECGVVGGSEDDVSGEGAGHDRLYTTNEDLLRVLHDRPGAVVGLERDSLVVPADGLGLLGQRGAQAREGARGSRQLVCRLVVLVEAHRTIQPAAVRVRPAEPSSAHCAATASAIAASAARPQERGSKCSFWLTSCV